MSNKGKAHRLQNQRLTIHHRKPTSIGGRKRDEKNLSYVPQLQHRSWHNLFSNHTAPTICAIINEKWLDPEYEFICRKRQT